MGNTKSDNWLWDLPAAFVLLTRLPLPPLPDTAFAGAARAVWAYPLVGLVLGVVVTVIGAGLGGLGLPALLVAGVVLAALVMLTGAMHEDGLADTADGLWGGMTRDRRLEIMKDSRIGTYGVLALVLAMGLRWQGYAMVSWPELIAALVMSRAAMPPLMAALPHARADGLSKRVGRPTLAAAALAVAIAAVVAVLLTGAAAIVAMLAAAVAICAIGALAMRKIGGQTGDILGAAQVMTEIILLLTFIAL